MTQVSDTGHVVWRFDLSQQFTAVQRISAALSRATDVGQALQAVLRVLHDDAFMQHSMICLYDPQRGALRVEALHSEDERVASSSSQVCYRPGKDWWAR
ncbi:Nif-specific regulatory protein [Dickeya solani]|nr:Nif-specific regulatory protein [Dickeya solani]